MTLRDEIKLVSETVMINFMDLTPMHDEMKRRLIQRMELALLDRHEKSWADGYIAGLNKAADIGDDISALKEK